MANNEAVINAIKSATNEAGEFNVEDVLYFYQKQNDSHIARAQLIGFLHRVSFAGQPVTPLGNGWYRIPFAPVTSTSACVRKAFDLLGLSQKATAEDIKQAFRNIVKASADGNGNYSGDMDALVQAKEKALAYVGAN